jgi:Fe-S-cluster containining protein
MSQHVCARCPKALTASCCEVKPHERLATLTWADVDRVHAATGLVPESFSEWEWLDADHVKAWLDVHPAYVGYLGPAPRRLTLRALDGKCALLDPARGCTLTEAERPIACRIYPFDVSDGLLQVSRYGELTEARRVVEKGTANACLAVEEATSEGALLRKLGMTAKKVKALAEQLRAEVADHARRERKGALGRR